MCSLLSGPPNPLCLTLVGQGRVQPKPQRFMEFELDRLIDYDDDEILAELKRVAAIAPVGTFSRRIFEQHSRVSAKTVRRRFGSWGAALQQEQLQGRYSGAVVTEKQMVSVAKQMTDAKLIPCRFKAGPRCCDDSRRGRA